jgi:hypothetical protein
MEPSRGDILGGSHKRGSEWFAFIRTYAIFQHLLQGPASGEDLVAAVGAFAGAEAYPPKKSALKAAFKHDRERLRAYFEVEFAYDPVQRLYRMTATGKFGYLHLSKEGLRGLGLLSRDFSNGLGERSFIRALLDEIIPRLSPEDRQKLDRWPEALALDVRQSVDQGHIPVRVWHAAQRSLEVHRKLSFQALSPHHPEGLPVYYEVAPIQVRYHEGHWYLRAWTLLRRTAGSEENREAEYRRFRLNYILDDEYLRVWPDVAPKNFRSSPRFFVHYRLAQEIGRGEVSHHFTDTQVTHLADGSAEVRGATDDVWEAARLLLSYGEGCVVLGGDELYREMRRRVNGMIGAYGLETG